MFDFNSVCSLLYVHGLQLSDLTVDCVWNTWTTWSECSQTCAGGIKTKTRSKAIIESGGGSCTGIDINEETGEDRDETSCNEDVECPTPYLSGSSH